MLYILEFSGAAYHRSPHPKCHPYRGGAATLLTTVRGRCYFRSGSGYRERQQQTKAPNAYPITQTTCTTTSGGTARNTRRRRRSCQPGEREHPSSCSRPSWSLSRMGLGAPLVKIRIMPDHFPSLLFLSGVSRVVKCF